VKRQRDDAEGWWDGVVVLCCCGVAIRLEMPRARRGFGSKTLKPSCRSSVSGRAVLNAAGDDGRGGGVGWTK